MISLTDAWVWYESVRKLTSAMKRLGMHHWNHLPWEEGLGRDNLLKSLEAAEILKRSETVLTDLDDLCVLLLFSVFEATVRSHVDAEIAQEIPELRHAALIHAALAVQESIQHGSFFKILEPYKQSDAGLIEEVNQVRRYRNWVAHGRHGSKPNFVDPQEALDRLQRFLTHFGMLKVEPKPVVDPLAPLDRNEPNQG